MQKFRAGPGIDDVFSRPKKQSLPSPTMMPKRKPRQVSIPGTGMKAQTNTGVTFDTSGTMKKKK